MASEFLKRMAAQSRARVDQEHGVSSYGGSGYGFQVSERRASPLEQLVNDIAADQTARVQDAETAARRERARRNYAAAQQRRAPVSGQLPGTSSGAAPLTAASFGGVTGYRNITPVRQEQPGGLRRIAQGADAAVSGLLGGIGSAVETGKAALGGQADFFSDVGLKGYLTTPMNQLGETRQSSKYQRQMDMDSAAARLMERSAEKTRETVEGLGPKSAWVAENLISVGQNAPAMAAALIPVVGPALGGGMMAASAGGSRAYELQQQGVDAGDAFWRGAVSGGIELATEKLSIDNFLQIAKGTGAKTAVKNLLRQMGVEASEESASYALNFIADKAANDPNAEFSLAELANSAAGGAFSGGIYGGVGLAVNRLGQRRTEAPSVGVREEMSGSEIPSNSAAARQAVSTPAAGDSSVTGSAETENVVRFPAQNAGLAEDNTGSAPLNRIGENGRKNLVWLQERAGRNDPDFHYEHESFYRMGRSGMTEKQFRALPQVWTMAENDRLSAFSAGHNDGLLDAAETVTKIGEGRAVSNDAIDQALSFARKNVEAVTGKLPENTADARKAVRAWMAERREYLPIDRNVLKWSKEG